MAATPEMGHQSRPARSLIPGDTIRVRGTARHAPRTALVIDVRGSESVSTGHVIIVRWQDDHTIAALIPRSELELVDTKQQ